MTDVNGPLGSVLNVNLNSSTFTQFDDSAGPDFESGNRTDILPQVLRLNIVHYDRLACICYEQNGIEAFELLFEYE